MAQQRVGREVSTIEAGTLCRSGCVQGPYGRSACGRAQRASQALLVNAARRVHSVRDGTEGVVGIRG